MKITVIGKSKVGKTQLIYKFVNNEEITITTSDMEERYKKNITIGNKIYNAEILDTDDRNDLENKNDMSIAFAEGFLLVFSINNKFSFDFLSKIRDKILKEKKGNFVPMVLVGNKHDLSNERKINYEKAKQLADSWGFEYIETSVNNNYNCKEAFEKLILKIASTRNKPKQSFSCFNCFIY